MAAREVLVEFRGEALSIREWSRRTGIRYTTLMERRRRGWPVEDMLTVQARKGNHPGARAVERHPPLRLDWETGVTIQSHARLNARVREVRARTENGARIPKFRLQVMRDEAAPDVSAAREVERPRLRGDCEPCAGCQEWRDDPMRPDGEDLRRALPCGHTVGEALRRSRPCVFVGCRHALYLEASQRGGLKTTFPDAEPGELPPRASCALDVAELGGVQLAVVGSALNLTRERARQIEESGKRRFDAVMKVRGLREAMGDCLEVAERRGEVGTPLGLAQVGEGAGVLYARPVDGEPRDEEPEDEGAPPVLSGVADPAVSDEQYADAVYRLLLKREARRELEAARAREKQAAEEFLDKDVQVG